jgi:hypothetical protein
MFAHAMKSALQHDLGLHAEERGLEHHQVRELAHLERRRRCAPMPCAMAGLIVYFAT